ncbi:MAG: DUF5117 domain-containing protein, partial [Chitinophagaceae bacterium]
MRYPAFILLAFCLNLFPAKSHAQGDIQAKTKSLTAYKGFHDFYWDAKTGKVWLKIDRFDEEFIYQTSLPAGIGSNDIGLDRGKLGTTYIVKFHRVGNKVLMIEPNYTYRALTSDANERRAVEQSFAQSVIWGFTVGAETNGSVLVDATSFLMRDAVQMASQLQDAKQGLYTADSTRSAIYLERTKNFPLNSEFESTITFINTDGKTGSYIRDVTPAPEAITIRMHHSFVKLPDNNFQTREYDARSPYI